MPARAGHVYQAPNIDASEMLQSIDQRKNASKLLVVSHTKVTDEVRKDGGYYAETVIQVRSADQHRNTGLPRGATFPSAV